MFNGMQEGACPQRPSHYMKLRSRLAEQNLLIVLDDLWERKALQHLLQMAPAKGVRYLVTSQMKEIWGPAEKIQMRYPTVTEARQIMSNYTNGLPMKGKFPHNIQRVTDAVIETVGYLPLSLADVGISINSSRATDARHWQAINDNLNHVHLHEDDFQVSPVMYEKSYDLTVGASMMLMVESLTPRPDARRLLFLIALLGDGHLPETLVRYFYKWIQSAQSTASLRLNYENQEKYLADRSLVDLHMQGNESTWERMPSMWGQRTVAGHRLRMRFIREKKSLDVRSIAAQILESSNQGGTEVIEKGDAEATLVTILSASYFQEPFTDVVADTLENHRRIIHDGAIPPNLSTGIHPHHDLVKRTRYQIERLVWLINVDHGDPAWKQKAHGCAKKIIIKLACQGILDDYSMAGLLQLPQTTSVACTVFEGYIRAFGSYDGNETVSSKHGETMNTQLTLLHDDGVSTTRRVPVIRAFGIVLDYESKDTILSVAAKYMELLGTDFSESTLQIAVARNLYQIDHCPTRAAILMGEFTGILDRLVALLVSVKDYEVRLSAAETLRWFCKWKCTALKVAAIPGALEKLFNFFLTTATLSHVASTEPEYTFLSSLAGYILVDLSSVDENRIKVRALQSGLLDGLGNILARLKGSWQGTHSEKHRPGLRERASIAAGILDQLALDKELKHPIASLPGLEEGLLFLQLIQIARITDHTTFIAPINSTRALTKLCCASTNPRLRDVPTLKQAQAVSSAGECPLSMGAAACVRACVTIYWSRVETHCQMGAYEEALENLEIAQLQLDQISTPDHGEPFLLGTSRLSLMGFRWSLMGATEILSCTRIFLQAMMGDQAGALLGANEKVYRTQLNANEKAALLAADKKVGTRVGTQLNATEKAHRARNWQIYCRFLDALIQRGIVRRLCRDLQGALDDLDAAFNDLVGAYQLSNFHGRAFFFWGRLFYILKHRGYIKYLMEDEVGASTDAEAAQRLQLKTKCPILEESKDDKCFWDIIRLPINYLGYFSSSKPSLS